MIQLLQINIQGFCSIVDPVTLPLNIPGVIRVSGSNGMGKTTMFSAIAWVLYGKNLKGKPDVNTWPKYRPKGYSGTKVELTWSSDKGICKVIRCLNFSQKLEDGAKGGNRLLLYVEGDLTQHKSKVAIQNEINSLMGLSYELFMSSVMFGQGLKRLIQESNADKKKLFEEIFKLDYLNVAKNLATNERNYIATLHKDNSTELEHTLDKIASQRSAVEALEKQQRNYQKDYISRKRSIKGDILDIKSTLRDLEKKLDPGIEKSLNTLNKALKLKQTELRSASQVKNIPLKDLIIEVYDLLTVKSFTRATKKLAKVIKAFETYSNVQEEIAKLNKGITEYRNLIRKQDYYQGEIKRLNRNLADNNKKLSQLEKKELPTIDPKFNQNIAQLKAKVKSLKEKQSTLDKQLEDYNWVLNDPLSSTGIKAFLFDSCLAQLNNNLQRYADILGFRIEFNVDLDSARKEFVTLIERDGVIIEYEELSGGEKAIVNLTMCLALHETLTLSKDINILLLDEVFENMSNDHIELVISLIKELGQGKTIFLISHIENLPFGNSRNLVVSKENGRTNYKGI